MIKKPDELARKLGLKFNNPALLAMALTHRSAGASNNERLEFLGDAILGFVITHKLYEQFPDASEGVLSRLRANLVNQISLAGLAREHQLGDYLVLGTGELKSGGFRRDSILSDALEAIIGALFKDQGIDACGRWILGLFEAKLNELSLATWQKDPKTQLQEIMQARRQELPEYTLVAMSGLPHQQTFKVKCSISLLQEECIGEGVSRKKAEQAAAELMLALLLSKEIKK
ncbi:MAG: ribonuclease III [Methylobacter sp.]|nr:MAG: ribonuclease III [Methylobacter sp.]PPD24313.1 MAG: ribonuclease III [Methylobacter sp.]PPD35448.1 MAG: ribonuclease III [Methylomonas sp.]